MGKKIIADTDHINISRNILISEYLIEKEYDILDIGTYTKEPVDYPDRAEQFAKVNSVGNF